MMQEAPAKPVLSRRAHLVLLLAFAGLIIITALNLAFPDRQSATPPPLLDYQVFHIAGGLAWEGKLATAYDPPSFWALTERLTGSDERMLWPYPPHFNLVTAPLALLPIGLGYVLFTAGSLLLYLAMLRRLAGGQDGLVLAMLFPAIMVCIRIGQNGLLIAGLMGWLAVLALQGRALAGVPLGLLTVKPQFLPGVGLYLLWQRQWRAIALGGLVTLLALALATALLGVSVWGDFRHSMTAVSGFLQSGSYPIYRMTSLFAAVLWASGDPGLALAVQIGFDLLLVLALLWAARRGWPQHQLLALAVMASTLMSPYGYEYDLPVFGIAIALLARDLVAAGGGRLVLLVPLAWLACGLGLVIKFAVTDAQRPALAVVPLLLLAGGLLATARGRRP